MKKMPFLEIAIVIAFIVLLYILIYPTYQNRMEINSKYDIISNVYGLRSAIEKYATLDANGLLPEEINESIITYLDEFGIVNPVTKMGYTVDDILVYRLENPLEINDNTLSGKHGMQRSAPGTFAYGIFTPDRSTYLEIMQKEKLTKQDENAIKNLNLDVARYTVTAFDMDSIPVTLEDKTANKIEVFFLMGYKTLIY